MTRRPDMRVLDRATREGVSYDEALRRTLDEAAGRLVPLSTHPRPGTMHHYVQDTKDDRIELPPFTAREREVVQLVAEGRSNDSIARRLGISPHTVKFHVNNVLERVGAANHTHLAALLVLAGVVDTAAIAAVRMPPGEE